MPSERPGACQHTPTHTHTYTHTYTHTHAHTHTHTHTPTHLHPYTPTHLNTYTHTSARALYPLTYVFWSESKEAQTDMEPSAALSDLAPSLRTPHPTEIAATGV